MVNSDLTLRTQLTEFRDHKLIRTRKVDFHFTIPQLSFIKCLQYLVLIIFALLQGADGVEYLIVAVDASTLMDFLENEEGD